MKSVGKTLLAICAASAGVASAETSLRPGSTLNNQSAIGAVTSMGSTAAFYNPANLTAKDTFNVDADLTLLNIAHTYEHPDYEPYQLNMTVPLITAGLTYRPNRQLVVGFSLFPTGAGTEATIAGLPLDLTPTVSSVADINAKQTAYDAALGAVYRFHRSLYVGVSATYLDRQREVAIQVEDTDDPVVDATMQASAVQPRLGVRSQVGDLRLGLFYAPATELAYSGRARSPALGQPDEVDVETVEYLAPEISIGARFVQPHWTVWTEVMHEQFSAGREIAVSGMNELDARETEFVDATSYAIGMDHIINSQSHWGLGAGYFPGNLEAGTWTGEGGVDELGVSGIQFGKFDALDRYSLGGFYVRDWEDMTRTRFGVTTSRGSATVADDRPRKGEYSLQTIGLSASLSKPIN